MSSPLLDLSPIVAVGCGSVLTQDSANVKAPISPSTEPAQNPARQWARHISTLLDVGGPLCQSENHTRKRVTRPNRLALVSSWLSPKRGVLGSAQGSPVRAPCLRCAVVSASFSWLVQQQHPHETARAARYHWRHPLGPFVGLCPSPTYHRIRPHSILDQKPGNCLGITALSLVSQTAMGRRRMKRKTARECAGNARS
ncbi:hypothetical protein F5Y08DRAFT_343836 [Xylaria arbuscula]|nr:hypothetical protein F5Y08DRAFT_343836 [Xylaria arbuscula]